MGVEMITRALIALSIALLIPIALLVLIAGGCVWVLYGREV